MQPLLTVSPHEERGQWALAMALTGPCLKEGTSDLGHGLVDSSSSNLPEVRQRCGTQASPPTYRGRREPWDVAEGGGLTNFPSGPLRPKGEGRGHLTQVFSTHSHKESSHPGFHQEVSPFN